MSGESVKVSLFPGGTESETNMSMADLAALLGAEGLVMQALASGKSIAYGQDAVTGTLTKATGLGLVETVICSSQSDPDGTTLMQVSATKGNQAGAPAAGSVILKCWKVTAANNAALIAATAAFTVSWIAIGTK